MKTTDHDRIMYHYTMYVQQAVKEWFPTIQDPHQFLSQGLVYVCGSKEMGVALGKTWNQLGNQLLKVEDWLSHAKRNKRYMEDTY
jgi:hypothetical protein